MGENSKIQWTDHTFNPWIGCTKVHEGCANCYAERDMDHRWQKAKWGNGGTRVLTSEANWAKPLKWDREAEASGERRRVFCASLADIFESWDGPIHSHRGGLLYNVASNPIRMADELDEPFNTDAGDWLWSMTDARARLFHLIDATPNLDWLLLTKRPEFIRAMWWGDEALGYRSGARHNVWLGTSISKQAHADKQIPELLKCRDLAKVLFLSVEPMVGQITLPEAVLRGERYANGYVVPGFPKIDWVIDGGESGPKAREYVLEYSLDLQAQCKAAGVPFFRKQLGAFPVATNCNLFDFDFEQLEPWGDYAAGVSITLKDRNGADMSEWPEEMRVREFPNVEVPA